MKKLNKHRCLALFYIAFGILMFWLSENITYMFSVSTDDVGPKFFPICCSVGFIICGIGKFLGSKNKDGKVFLAGKGWLRLLVIIAVMAAYIFCLTYFGYIASTLVMLTVLPYMLCGENEKPKFWKVLLFSIITTCCIYFVFVKLMKVMLPAGKWMKVLLKALR